MNDETNQLLLALLNRFDEFQAETVARQERFENEVREQFKLIEQRFKILESQIEQCFAQVNERVKTLENQMLTIGFELKQDIADLSEKITQSQVQVYEGRADAARALAAVASLEKRVIALEAEVRAA